MIKFKNKSYQPEIKNKNVIKDWIVNTDIIQGCHSWSQKKLTAVKKKLKVLKKLTSLTYAIKTANKPESAGVFIELTNDFSKFNSSH